MPSRRKKKDDGVTTGTPRAEGQPGGRSDTNVEPPVENRSSSLRSRPEWQPAKGHEADAGLTAMLQLYLDESYSRDATWRHRLVEALLDQADQGNVRALQEIWIRLEGRPGALDTEAAEPPDIDAGIAAKILEASCTDDEDPPVD